ncbi:hypothetical protein TNCV_287071 [Trichonephila clavipes]|nr:hypothetical protein TNCV_287071 [Trichonephila clavipes]
MDKTTLPAVMKMEDLINGECTIPEKLDRFFKALIEPSKHITLGMTVKSLTSSRKMINILNRLGHCCNYNTLEKLETEATISSVNRSQICPPDSIQSPSLSTDVTFDNFDRYVDTLTGKDTLHDTVGIIYKIKRRRTFNEEIPELPSFNHRLQMLENLTPVENEPTLSANLPLVETIELLYLLSHFLHVPNTPMGTGSNSKIIKDTSP